MTDTNATAANPLGTSTMGQMPNTAVTNFNADMISSTDAALALASLATTGIPPIGNPHNNNPQSVVTIYRYQFNIALRQVVIIASTIQGEYDSVRRRSPNISQADLKALGESTTFAREVRRLNRGLIRDLPHDWDPVAWAAHEQWLDGEDNKATKQWQNIR